MAVALCISFLIHEIDVGKGLYLVAVIWPYALPPAVAGLVFLFIAHPNIGIFTSYIGPLSVVSSGSSPQAFVVVLIAAVWSRSGTTLSSCAALATSPSR